MSSTNLRFKSSTTLLTIAYKSTAGKTMRCIHTCICDERELVNFFHAMELSISSLLQTSEAWELVWLWWTSASFGGLPRIDSGAAA